MKRYSLFFGIMLLLLTGCEAYVQDDYQEKYVVESYQVALEPLAEVRLTKTAPVNDQLNLTANAVRGATVRVNLLRADGSIEQSLSYIEGQGGYYAPSGYHRVLPNRTYQLEVNVPNYSPTIRAKTTIPDTLTVLSTNGSTFTYQQEQLRLRMSPSINPSRKSYFIFTVEALAPSLSNLTSFYQQGYERNPDQIPPVRYSSPILNEGNYQVNPDNSFEVDLPWLAVVYYGQNRGYVNAIDDNIYDFFRSQSVQLGGGVLSPGEIPNAIYHVENAIGVFGSYAHATHLFQVNRP